MKSIKQTFALICIALLICDSMYMVQAVSTERRSQLRKLKHNKSSTKIPATFTPEKRIAYGKGIVIGLFLGAIFKLITAGVSQGLKEAFAPGAAATDANEFMKQNTNLGKIEMTQKLISGDSFQASTWKWETFAPVVAGAGAGFVGSVIKAPTDVKADEELTDELNGEEHPDTDELKDVKAAGIVEAVDTAEEKKQIADKVTAIAPTAIVAGQTITDEDEKKFAELIEITKLAQSEMNKVQVDAKVTKNDADQKANKKGAQDAGEKMVSVSFRTIIKNYAANYKKLFMKGTAWTAWKNVAKNILKGVVIAVALTAVTIANPAVGAALTIAYAAYNACKSIYGIYKQVQACRAAVDAQAYVTCGSQGIGTGMGIISLLGRRRRHRHSQVKKITKKTKKQIQ